MTTRTHIPASTSTLALTPTPASVQTLPIPARTSITLTLSQTHLHPNQTHPQPNAFHFFSQDPPYSRGNKTRSESVKREMTQDEMKEKEKKIHVDRYLGPQQKERLV
jgi:hypothetical protein